MSDEDTGLSAEASVPGWGMGRGVPGGLLDPGDTGSDLERSRRVSQVK